MIFTYYAHMLYAVSAIQSETRPVWDENIVSKI